MGRTNLHCVLPYARGHRQFLTVRQARQHGDTHLKHSRMPSTRALCVGLLPCEPATMMGQINLQGGDSMLVRVERRLHNSHDTHVVVAALTCQCKDYVCVLLYEMM